MSEAHEFQASRSSLWDVMAVDPAIPMDRATLRLVIRDQRRPSRALIYPWLRILSRATVTVIVAGKRICPVRFSAHATMDRMCLWFLRRFVSPTAVSLLIRHFIVETNLLNFCLTPGEYRRAVHSLRLDASLLNVLAALTGDDTFARWRTALPPVRVDSDVDVPETVYEHALLCEYALARLCEIRDAAASRGSPGGGQAVRGEPHG